MHGIITETVNFVPARAEPEAAAEGINHRAACASSVGLTVYAAVQCFENSRLSLHCPYRTNVAFASVSKVAVCLTARRTLKSYIELFVPSTVLNTHLKVKALNETSFTEGQLHVVPEVFGKEKFRDQRRKVGKQHFHMYPGTYRRLHGACVLWGAACLSCGLRWRNFR